MRFAIPRLALLASFLGVLTLGAAARAERPELLHSPRAEIQAGHPLVIDGTLIGTAVDRLTLHYRAPGGTWRETPMELQYGDLFRATVPGDQVVPPRVEYFIDGTGYSGQHFELFRSALKPARVEVIGQAPPPPVQVATRPPPPPPPTPPEVTEPTPHREPPRSGPTRIAPTPAGPPVSRPHPTEAPPTHAEPAVVAAAPSSRPHPDAPRLPEFHTRTAFEEDLAVYSAQPVDALTATPAGVARTPSLVFDRAQIRALGARSVFDVLGVVPGLSTSRDVQGNWRVAVRGLRSAPEVLFLLNGHRLNNFWDGRALANLPVDNLERIEITRGPGAAENGVNAVEAVVNLVTDHSDGVRATVAGGSFKTLDGHLSAATHRGELQLFADADLLRQDGYALPVAHDALDLETIAQGRDPGAPAGLTNDRRALVNVGAGLSYGDPRANAGLSLRFVREDRGALIGLFDTVGHSSNLGWNILMADATFERWFSERFSLTARAYGDLQSTDRNFQLSRTDFVASTDPNDADFLFPNGLFERFVAKTRTLGLDGRAHIQLAEGNRLQVGVQLESASLTDYSQELNFSPVGLPLDAPAKPEGLLYPEEAVPSATSRLTVGTFAEDVWSLGRALQLDFGFRLDAVQLPTTDDPTQASLVSSFNPRAGITYSPLAGFNLHLGYARAFRAPTVEEYALPTPDTFFTHGQYEGNPALVPATVDSVELGADLTQSVEGARVHIQGNVFLQSFTHPIAAVDTSGNIIPLRNREGVRVWGAEGSARVELSRRASAWANASFFRAVDTETPDDFQLLTDTPQARFNAGLTLPLGPYLNFDVYAQIGSERRNLSRTVLEQIRRYSIPAYSLVTAQLRTERIADHFELALVGHNVFDVQRFDDVPRPDRITGLLPREGLWASLILTASY